MPPHKLEIKKTAFAVAIAAAMVLCGCAQGLPATSLPAPLPESQAAAESQGLPGAVHTLPQSVPTAMPPGGAASALPGTLGEDYLYEAEMLALVNVILEEYASGALPEPMRYNTDYSGLHNAAPPDTVLPQAVALPDVGYEVQSGGGAGPDTITARLQLENDYTMDIQIDLDNSGAGRPTRVTGVSFYDMQGASEADFAMAPRGGDFLYLRSDRLFASADFEEVNTEAGVVSGSISWSKAGQFLWIDIDSMREPFFYTYFIAGEEGELRQDYPQKEWQRLSVISDERMFTISTSLYGQFRETLAAAWPDTTL